MQGNEFAEREAFQFILDKIDSVPHLEALLLLWNTRPDRWSAEDLARRLYIRPHEGRNLLADLNRDNIIVVTAESAEQFWYESKSEEQDRVIGLVDAIYRRQVVRVSTLIHSKASSAVRDFARAFRFTKD